MSPTSVACREVFYLARVAAFRYLDAAASALTGAGGVPAPAVPPDDVSHVPCGCASCAAGRMPRSGRRNDQHDIAAFKVYAATERGALDAIAQLSGDTAVRAVVNRLAEGIVEGRQVRANLAAKGRPLPGRGRWLLPPTEGGGPVET